MAATDQGGICIGDDNDDPLKKPDGIPQQVWDEWFTESMILNCALDQVSCMAAGEAAGIAYMVDESLQRRQWEGDTRLDGGPANAIKHALWNALMAASPHVGREGAKKWADLREQPYAEGEPSIPEAAKMDFHNNRIGRSVGARFYPADISDWNDIARAVYDEYFNVRMYCMYESDNCGKNPLP
jgi:hypothetical protein